jgi:GxxExxY protein
MERDWTSQEATPGLPAEINKISESIIGAAIEVHRALGPGMLEKLYREALQHELLIRHHAVKQEVPIDFAYKGIRLVGQRLDLLVDGMVVVELKAVTKVDDVHLAQLTSYLRSGGYPLGLLLNFHVPVLKQGIFRRFQSKNQSMPPPRSSTLVSASAISANPPRPLRSI